MRIILSIVLLIASCALGYMYFFGGGEPSPLLFAGFIVTAVLFVITTLTDTFSVNIGKGSKKKAGTSRSRRRSRVQLSSFNILAFLLGMCFLFGAILLGILLIDELSKDTEERSPVFYTEKETIKAGGDTIVTEVFPLPEKEWVRITHPAYTKFGDTIKLNYFIPSKVGTYMVKNPLGTQVMRLEYWAEHPGSFQAYDLDGNEILDPIGSFFDQNRVIHWKSCNGNRTLTRASRLKQSRESTKTTIHMVSQQ